MQRTTKRVVEDLARIYSMWANLFLLLSSRYSVEDEPYTIWVWVMFWTPVPDGSRYTEESLLRMIEAGRLVLYKNDD